MDDQNNNSQDAKTDDVNAAVVNAEDSTVTEAPTAKIAAEVEAEAANPFAALKESEDSEKSIDEPQIEEPKESAASDEEPEEKAESVDNEEKIEASASDEEPESKEASSSEEKEESKESEETEAVEEPKENAEPEKPAVPANPNARWYVVHTFAGHENKVATALRQRIEAEHLENLIYDILVPTQDKIEIKGGKKETVKEKIFPGYILIKMELSDLSWLAVRTTQGVTSFIGAGNKPTPISEAEVASIVKFTTQGASPTFKDVFMVDDTVKIVDGPFAEFIGKVDSVDKEKGRVRVLVSIFGRETPVELDFLQVQKL